MPSGRRWASSPPAGGPVVADVVPAALTAGVHPHRALGGATRRHQPVAVLGCLTLAAVTLLALAGPLLCLGPHRSPSRLWSIYVPSGIWVKSCCGRSCRSSHSRQMGLPRWSVE